MVKYITGKFGRDAIQQFSRDIHLKRISGKLDITPKMEKQIVERTKKVFEKNDKAPLRIRERDLQKEVLNVLRIKHDDAFSPKNVEDIDKGFGFTEHTKEIGNKYAFALQQEKRAEIQKQREALKAEKEKAIEFKKEQNIAESKKQSNEPGSYAWLESLRNKFAKKDQRITGAPYSAEDNKFGGAPSNPYAEKDAKLGGIKSNSGRETTNNHGMSRGMIGHGGVSEAPRSEPHEGASSLPNHAEPPRHTEAPPVSEFDK